MPRRNTLPALSVSAPTTKIKQEVTVMKKCSRYEPFTHIKVKDEYVRVNKKTTRDGSDGKGWLTYHTDNGDYTDKNHKGFYIEE